MISTQLNVLIDLGLADVAGVSASMLARYANALPDEPGAVLAVHPSLASACQLAPLLRRGQKPGFVVRDLADLEEFGPIAGLEIPDSPLPGPRRGPWG